MTASSPSDEYQPRSRTAQAIGGVLLALMGGFIMWLARWMIVSSGMISPGLAFLGAGMVCFGLGLAIFGGFKEERLARGESLEGRSGWALLTARWWGVLIVGAAAGVAYAAALWNGWFTPPP
jgi:hypothetical protein